MRFQFTDDQRVLKAATRELLERVCPAEVLRAALAGSPGLDRRVWAALGEAGVFALRLPEETGGVGLGRVEAVLVFEELGRALVPGPLVATHLAAGVVPGAATGERVVAREDGGLVAWLAAADAVVTADSGGAPVDTSRGVPLRSLDPLTPLHRVPPGGEAAGWDVEGALLVAAEQLGTAARVTDLAVRYAKEREQFGRPVGAFQAVKHLCADMLVRTEVARAALYGAAVTGDRVEVAGAKLLADDAAVRGARDCLQVHGGMGFTWEADVHLHLKRAWVRARMRPRAAEAEEVQAQALTVASL
ncbi:acyl-CoA dehydrogenase family protein [Streptomyces sp. NPDC048057]|uniref:acyl-CoA dehydrogenase family protein n=1 Tax=Streptomyces sp. NPDC048057 TaxID=3155628 RepID=UPI0033F41FEB